MTLAVPPPHPLLDPPVPDASPDVRYRGLAPRLAAALDTVAVARGAREATVAGRTVSADSPRDLRGRLTNALYEELHAGRHQGGALPDGPPPRRTLRDPALEERLAAAVPHRTTPTRGRLVEVLSRPDGDQLVVRLAEVTARVPADRLLGRVAEVPPAGRRLARSPRGGTPIAAPGESPRTTSTRASARHAESTHQTPPGPPSGRTTGLPQHALAPATPPAPGAYVELALEAARPALSPGFFYVMGSRPLPRPAGAVRRLFLHARDADAAVVLWGAALDALETAGARYHAKVLSDPQDFPRRDAVVVYLHGDHLPGERAVAAAVAPHAGTLTGPATSVFTEELAPGVAAAWDPEDPRPGQNGMSFGQHRAFALASGLIAHALADGPHAPAEFVVRAFHEAGIDPLHPQNNLDTRPGDAR
ncbi:T3SS effector HopA1 family protein [Streptomyces sp. NPDC057740]|uniref:T3SS effector HopA1 family protein n=1 Tax=Streptomyces sp. NPDC057740 TaxID=3346234 RepID=UPI00367A648F